MAPAIFSYKSVYCLNSGLAESRRDEQTRKELYGAAKYVSASCSG